MNTGISNPSYAQPNICLYNADNKDVMANLQDENVDVILTDPPYLYLKGQKLEREFDERKFFSECKRVLTKNGFIVLFGRGTSFYRWNTILDELGFNFKEEIIWNKRRASSPVLAISRVHETISIFSKGKGAINNVKVPYGELKAFDQDKVYEDIKRLGGLFNKGKVYEKVVEDLKSYSETGSVKEFGLANTNYRTTCQTRTPRRNVSTYTLIAMEEGLREQSIVNCADSHYGNIHPTQKPVRLLERLLALVIPKDKPREEITVLDPFGGSFSTMEAVYNMQMQGISCEIDKEYFESGKNRIENLPPIQTNLFD